MMKIDRNLIYKAIHDHKNEILETGDWWWGFEDHTLNVFCYDDQDWELPTAKYEINVYTLGENGNDDYAEERMNVLPSMTRQGLRLL